MKLKTSGLLLVIFLLPITMLYSQQKYEGTLVSKFGESHKGIIQVNLNGANDELIEIVSTEKTKSKGTTQTVTHSLKMNVAIIKCIIINDTTWYFRDIKYDYNEKYYMNVCVRLVEGSLDCGIFQTGRSDEMNNTSIKLPNADFSKLVSPDFDYYHSKTGWHIMAFGKCSTLRKKMQDKISGYFWDDNTKPEDRIAMWKNWVKEFNNCGLNQ